MHPTSFVLFAVAQAAAEYGVVTARRTTGASSQSLQQVLDGAKDFLSHHTVAVVVGAIVMVALYRFVFAPPRVH